MSGARFNPDDADERARFDPDSVPPRATFLGDEPSGPRGSPVTPRLLEALEPGGRLTKHMQAGSVAAQRVAAWLESRRAVGIEAYGHELHHHDVDDPLREAAEEVADAVVYIEAAIMQAGDSARRHRLEGILLELVNELVEMRVEPRDGGAS